MVWSEIKKGCVVCEEGVVEIFVFDVEVELASEFVDTAN
jgi:hypothetical protein